MAELGAQLAADVLHEDQVPDFEVAVLVGDRAAILAVFGAPVVVDLRAGATGPGYAHVPVVVLAVTELDALFGDPGDATPDLGGLRIGFVGGDPDAFGVEPVAAILLRLGDQLPGEGDRALLEVIAEGEVAGHLEEGVVPGSDAHFFDIPGAHAFLHARRPRERRGFLAEEVRLELDHARVDEQQVRVVEDQRGAGHLGMPGAHEMVQESPSDLVGLHKYPAYRCGAPGFSSSRPSSSHLLPAAHSPRTMRRNFSTRGPTARSWPWSVGW